MNSAASSWSPSWRAVSARAEAVCAGICLLAVVICAGVHLHLLHPVVVDDAAISLRYGLTLFGGNGLRLTPHSAPVEGFSNPLWTVLIGSSRLLHLPPLAFMRWLGVGFGMLALFALALIGPCALGRGLELQDVLAPAFVAASPSFLTWIASGLETGLYAFLLASFVALASLEFRRGRGAKCGWLLGAACLTRPEGILFAAIAGAVWGGACRLEHRKLGRQTLRVAAEVALLVGGWVCFRLIYFADLLPNTYWAKRLWTFNRANYLEGFVHAYGWLCALAMVASLLVAILGPANRCRALAWSLGGVLTGAVFAWVAHGDWMGEWRFLVPYAIFLGVPVGLAVGALRERRMPWRWSRWPLVGVILLGSGAAVAQSLSRSAGVARAPQFPYRFVAKEAARVRATSASLGQKHPLLALPDLGGLAMALPEADILDDAGLADYAVAHHAGDDPAVCDYLLSEGPPILLDVHGPSGSVVHCRKLMARYRRLSGSLWVLRGLSATEDPRCPGGKAATTSVDAAGLSHAFETDLRESQFERAIRRLRCAEAYLPDARMPSRQQRAKWSAQALASSDALRVTRPQRALRALSLATLLEGGEAWLRRKTERLRTRLFPPKTR